MQNNNDTCKQVTEEDKKFIKYFTATQTKKKLDDCLLFSRKKSSGNESHLPSQNTACKKIRKTNKSANVEHVIQMRWKQFVAKKENL